MAKNSEKLLTICEAKALCLVKNLLGSQFGADQAKAANTTLIALLRQNRVDDSTFAEVGAFLGNHSAIRQWAVKQGLLKVEVAEDALAKEVRRLQALDAAELDAMV